MSAAYLVAGAAAAFACHLALEAGSARRAVARRARALVAAQSDPSAPRAAAAPPLGERLAGPLLGGLAAAGRRLTPAGSHAALERRLAQAGMYGPGARQAVMAAVAAAWVLGLAAGWAAWQIRPALGLVAGGTLAAAGLLLPRAVLAATIARRRRDLTGELPDVLDLLTACVEAGLGFDAAVMRIAGRPTRGRSALREELTRYLTDVRLGRSRQEALRDLGERGGVADLGTVTSALTQADQLGVGISSVLRAQGLQLRTRRRQQAQAAALQAPVKMIFPLVFFVFPAMFVVTLGPAALRLIDTFSKVGPR